MSDEMRGPNDPVVDTFEDRWNKSKKFWLKVHDRWNYNYLMYRSILTYNQIYGEKYLEAFGLQVFVPRTFMTVESLASSENARKIEFVVEPLNWKSAKLSKYVQKMDNAEWRRSKTNFEALKARKDSMIFGNGYLENVYVDDVVTRHIPLSQKEMDDLDKEKEEEKMEVPEVAPEADMMGDTNMQPLPDMGGLTEEDRALSQVGMMETTELPDTDEVIVDKVIEEKIITDKTGVKWRKQKVVRYRGMKGTCLNPYYVFWDPEATSDMDAQDCFVYKIMAVERAREYVVSKGWMTEKEAIEKIVETPVDVFDGIRETVDWMYKLPTSPWSRGDHQDPADAGINPTQSPRSRSGCTAIIERWTEDKFEARLADAKTVLFDGYNSQPHKQIPIIPFWGYPIPHEFIGMGEPEVIRHQQVEENKLHNFLLQSSLIAIVNRFAINTQFLEDENDAFFTNPFRPIRLKPLPGVKIEDAIMALPQPDVKRTPFELMNMVQAVLQQTTGANDFVVSASQGATDTATESNNLVAATSTRVKERLRGLEYSIQKTINQWHPCYFTFYDEEMDVRITGKARFWKYVPLDREEANENQELIQNASKKLNAVGATLTDVYKKAGYEEVFYISDLMGEFEGQAVISDPEQDEQKTIAMFRSVIDNLILVNDIAAKQGVQKRYDVFKVGEDMLRNVSILGDVDEYVIDEAQLKEQEQMAQMKAQQAQMNGQPAPAPGAEPPMPEAPAMPEPPTPPMEMPAAPFPA